eukprot:gnl/MRDRNA2_/MRDRNA2_92936_c0_seq1.p1 gnl/MRDRNA2_/MRDRNA2_92936_c0~~gnl/MRDRNA2_/MRDRNA2_92936_c0_seq1.p1  ORF type:complete len:234 (+),score=44.03 gnl/MRDRNA2_/MRDRNA2_92936_c0_seq1:70-771(+)
MMCTPPTMTCAGTPTGSQQRRKFLTQREFQELQMAAKSPSEVGPLPMSSHGILTGDKPSVSSASKTQHDSPDGGLESEIETQISESSELPSSASAVAAVQFQHAVTTNDSILSEVERLRQENLALRSENAELRGNPAQAQMMTMPQECGVRTGIVTYAVSPSQSGAAAPPVNVAQSLVDTGHMGHAGSPTACQEHLRFGAPLQYVVVASPVGNSGSFEFGFNASDAQQIWRCS